ncbi:PilZ domain-containing protein [Sphingorhabdus sp. 109]|jgi:hypothetical protein|uniref:PilZ domain-containing protein n=1 Tax=Sphingorhabdus sp. 109 TaxID=2653173 RepID=UPI0012EF98C3|nr:PilZ domain-containing protein [Sphingorhabdus sp. 109]VWX61331.1 conserved hypothetical protein [Sphingorhabdus sp. 109]
MAETLARSSTISAGNGQPAMQSAAASGAQRFAPGYQVAIKARMRFSCSRSFPVEITSISLAGFTSDALQPAHPGTLCWLTLPGLGALEAEVVRSSNQGISCAFKNVLNPAVLNHYMTKYQAD